MQIILIKNNILKKLTLPQIITGNFWVTDIDENGNDKNLINIKAIDGEWNLISNLEVFYIEKGKKIPQIVLKEYRIYTIKSKNEYFYIYCCPLIDNSYKYYDITNYNQDIYIGRSPEATITYKFNPLNDVELKIEFRGNYPQIIPNENSQLGVFLKNYKINYPSILENGDYIFISGLKIIYLVLKEKRILLVNNPNNMVSIKLKDIPRVEYQNTYIKSDNDNDEEIIIEENYFHKKPRFIKLIEKYNIEISPPPKKNDKNKMPLILVIGPMITTSMMSLTYGYNAISTLTKNNGNLSQGIMQLITCFTMLIGTMLWPSISRRYESKKNKEYEKNRQEKYTKYLEEVNNKINKELENQKEILFNNLPNLQECQNTILNKTVDLWQRRVEDYDFLTINVGYGNVPMEIEVNYRTEDFQMEYDELQELATKIGSEKKILVDVPISFSLRDNNALAIIGEKEDTQEYIQKILLQLIAFHSYDNLKIALLTDENNAHFWEFIKPLPHLYNDSKTFRYFGTSTEEYKEILYQLDSVFNKRKEDKENNKEDYNPHYLIITDSFKAIRNFEIIRQILENNNMGFSIIIINTKLSSIPDQCQNFINISENGGELFKNILNEENKIFKVDNTPTNIEECINTLANVPIEIIGTTDGQMPNKVGFLEMYNVGTIEQLNIANRWETSNPILSLSAPVGIGKSGEKIGIDLHEKYHGPHGLVAGMTGSGKSEFLISYILSMAVNYHPYEVQFILIDYKGGGLAGAFENKTLNIKLPHLVGTITNLDKNEINRSLASIESELKSRQRKFNEAREKAGESTIDIYKYQNLYRKGVVQEPISHLFIISDEFAELKAQQPEFMDKLISTARIGRSLGVHLILATQKPAGVVNDQIWSNTRFRVCLRVQDTADSNDMLKCPDAAYLTNIGRFYFQVGQNEIFTIGQSAYCGVPYIPSESIKKQEDTSINIINNLGISTTNLEEEKKEVKIVDKGEELLNIVTTLSEIGKEQNIKTTPLWLPKIPELIYIENIKKQFNYKPTLYNFNPVIGLYDNPDAQYQGLATLDFTKEGNTIIYGISSSGEVLILGTLIYSLSIEHTPQEVNIYAIDCGSETLNIYKDLPQVGDVALITEKEKINNLFKLIMKTIEERKKLFVEYNGEFNYYIKHSGKTLPAIFLIISSYEAFNESYGELNDLIKVISRDSVKYGIYLLFTTTTTNGVPGLIARNFGNILTLQMNDDSDYRSLMNTQKRVIPAQLYGRGLIKLDDVYEFQTAQITNSDNTIQYIKDLAKQLKDFYKDLRALKIPILPEVVKAEEIIDETSTLEKLPIGISKTQLAPVKYNFTQGTIILASDSDSLPSILNNFLKALSKFANIIVIDSDGLIEEPQNYIYLKGNEEENLNKLINIPNDGKQYICIFVQISQFIKKIGDEQEASQKLEQFFSKTKESNPNIHFILLDTPDSLKDVSFENWFKDNFDSKNGIYVGNGIDSQTIIKADDAYKLAKTNIANNFAFVIKKGKATLIKIVEE